MIRRLSLVFAISAVALAAPASRAQETGCVYNRSIYPEGTEACRNGSLQRCEHGSWGDIGFCDESPPPPPPEVSGGDVPIEDRPYPPGDD